jgi:hypothetical protein
MTIALKKTRTRVVGWLKAVGKFDRPLHRWNEYDWYGS